MIDSVENLAAASPEASHLPSKSVSGKKTAHPIEVRERVYSLYVSGVPALEIEKQTGVPVNTIRKWRQAGACGLVTACREFEMRTLLFLADRPGGVAG
jgi:hypothetical protein